MSIALWAWIIVGAVVVVIAVVSLISMIPEIVRYLKLKSM